LTNRIYKVKRTELFQPVFGVDESVMPAAQNFRIGGRVEAIINYEVIEKTKSYTILKISHVHLLSKDRRM